MKGTRSFRIQILTIRKTLEAFECKFEPFERDSKRSSPNFYPFKMDSNATSNNLKGTQSIWIQIRTIRKEFEAFECKFKLFESKFEPFERDSKHSNADSNYLKGIRSIRIQIWTIRIKIRFESKFDSNPNLIRIQIRTIRMGWNEFKLKFEPFERDSKHSNANSNYSNLNSNHSKGIQSIRMQIRTQQYKV